MTGTGTEVGKTVVAAAIAHTLAASGASIAVFKPAVTGLDEPAADEPDHELLRRAAGSAQSDDGDRPLPLRATDVAASRRGTGRRGDRAARLLAAARTAAAAADTLVCEGVGGLLVPSDSPRYLVRDLAVDLALPLVIAASPGLGTINHTLLTIEAARAAGLDVAAVVLTPWPEQPDADRGIEPRDDRRPGRGRGRDPAAPRPRRPAELAEPASGPLAGCGMARLAQPTDSTTLARPAPSRPG